jgi:hypothetical protein
MAGGGRTASEAAISRPPRGGTDPHGRGLPGTVTLMRRGLRPRDAAETLGAEVAAREQRQGQKHGRSEEQAPRAHADDAAREQPGGSQDAHGEQQLQGAARHRDKDYALACRGGRSLARRPRTIV